MTSTACLALCFDAPMQSWGLRSRFTHRDTAREPTKSGVVGLLAAALGIPRDDLERVKDLAALRMAVRVDREGSVERDYHTVQNVISSNESNHQTLVSERFYLADALFLTLLEGPVDELHRLHEALTSPHWPLFLGRRSFVPARPLVTPNGSLFPDTRLDAVLESHAWLETRPDLINRARYNGDPSHLRTMTDTTPNEPAAELRPDHPMSFVSRDRRFSPRAVLNGHVPLTPELISSAQKASRP